MPFTSSFGAFATQDTALLREWGQGISTGCVAAGLLDTNPTGKVVWNTVVSNAATSFIYGFDVFLLNDALRFTHPIFIKLEYRNRTGVNNVAPLITLTIGTTHDGAGGIGGNTRSHNLQFTGASFDLTRTRQYFAAGDGWCNILLWPEGLTSLCKFIGIDRVRDADGQITTAGVYLNLQGSENGPTPSQYYLPYTGTIPALEARWGLLLSPSVTAVTNPDIGAVRTRNHTLPGRIYHFNGGVLPFPTTTVLMMRQGQFPSGEVFDMPLYNAVTGSYLAFPESQIATSNGLLVTGMTVAVRIG